MCLCRYQFASLFLKFSLKIWQQELDFNTHTHQKNQKPKTSNTNPTEWLIVVEKCKSWAVSFSSTKGKSCKKVDFSCKDV